MADNLSVYDKVRIVPPEAQKAIKGGRLTGMTDINPMWRLKTLTEQFGVCGFGWKFEITDKRLESGPNEEISAFVDINLYIKMDGEWSAAIPGTGGSSFIAKESKGPYMSDECFKMALTDAISVSCKSLGVGADVYWEKDTTKYTGKPQDGTPPPTPPSTPTQNPPYNAPTSLSEKQVNRAFAKGTDAGIQKSDIIKWIRASYNKDKVEDLTKTEYDELCAALDKKKGDK